MREKFNFKKRVIKGSQDNGELFEEQQKNEAIFDSVFNGILTKAVDSRASDVHFECYADGQRRVRIRIDGVLHPIGKLRESVYTGVLNRIKILAGLDITNRREAQDGSFSMEVHERQIDIRVSVLPTIFGDKIVLRLLDAANFLMPIENLGMKDDDEKIVKRMMRESSGLILITGATGCGKTTTLYSMLERLNDDHLNITTIENPPEYLLFGINQTAITAKMNFETSLRAVLRQDPDVIMLGEIRDASTAQTAVRAAITGHLVLSTLHTNDALSTVDRLIDMGVPPYLLTAAIKGIVSQRLIRLLCPKCRKAYAPSESERKLFSETCETAVFYQAPGCEFCHHTGYYGRKGIFEVLPFSTIVKQTILDGGKSEALKEIAIKTGITFFADLVCQEVRAGNIDVREGIRVMNDEKR